MAAPPPPDAPGSPGDKREDALGVAESDAKAKLDDTELQAGSPRAQQKVELDLDDAPFLEEEEAAPEPEPEIPTAPPQAGA